MRPFCGLAEADVVIAFRNARALGSALGRSRCRSSNNERRTGEGPPLGRALVGGDCERAVAGFERGGQAPGESVAGAAAGPSHVQPDWILRPRVGGDFCVRARMTRKNK